MSDLHLKLDFISMALAKNARNNHTTESARLWRQWPLFMLHTSLQYGFSLTRMYQQEYNKVTSASTKCASTRKKKTNFWVQRTKNDAIDFSERVVTSYF